MAGPPLYVMGRGNFGDTILCARFVPLHPDPVVFVVNESLRRLFASLGVPLMTFDDFHREQRDASVSVVDLPGVRGFFGRPHPFFDPPPSRRDQPPPARLWADPTVRWHHHSDRPLRGLRVGLCWATSEPHKDIPASLLSTPLDRRHVTLVSLQAGPHAADLSAVDLPRLVADDWAETAGLVRQCDLVITVDTAVAHLAGSLGVPTWLLIQTPSYYIWGDGETTPWYPSMRIFRQPTPGDWWGMVSQVIAALDALQDAVGGTISSGVGGCSLDSLTRPSLSLCHTGSCRLIPRPTRTSTA